MFMLCLAVMWHAPHLRPAAMHLHRTIGFSRARTLVLPCVLTPQLPPFAIAHLTPYSLSILSLLAFHHSSAALSIPLSFPHRPSPFLAKFLSMACVLKRFPLTSPRKLALTCVKRGFLRTAEPHRTSQLSPCALLMSKCHVHALPGRDVPCSFTTAPSAPPARELLPCPVPNPTAPTLRNPTSAPYTLSIPLSSPNRPSPILAAFLSTACVLKRFPLTLPRKLALPCVKRGFLRTAGTH